MISIFAFIVTGLNIYHLLICKDYITIIILAFNIALLVLILLSNRKIYEKKERIELNKIKAKFLSNISHELKTPLNGIMGMNNLLKNSKLTDEQEEYSQIINSCSENLLSTINDILDFSKIEKGNLSVEHIDFDLRKLINDFYNMSNLSAEIKNIKFDYSIDSEAPTYFVGDPVKIRQIISAFFSNAIKFTHKGSIDLSCILINETESHSTIKFSIKDTGIGISKDDINRLFKKFTQGDSSISKEYKGIGLGLSISKQLITLMNGEFGVESHIGIGTEFWFSLDLQRSAQLRQPKSLADTATAKCLLVRSNNIDMERISHMFDNTSIENRVVNTYKEAIHLITSNNYNLLLFDINMSPTEAVSLKDFTEYIYDKTEINLIALTPEGRRGDGELCRSLKIDAYLVDPFTNKVLLETISIILAHREKGELITVHALVENRKSQINILVVDDNNVNLIIAKKLLSKMGFHSETSLSGKDAIETLKKGKFDLVFMDLQMPEMNGLQATSAIRNEEAGHNNRNIPIVALTANTTTVDRLNCSQVGMDGFLTKPYQPKSLEETINRFLKWNVL